MTASLVSLKKRPTIVLVGNPNCGKTALFNLLTGSQQKTANYAGVTVERKSGILRMPNSQEFEIVDLPGIYSLSPTSQDEQVTCDVLSGQRKNEQIPDAIICVLDATHLQRGLRLLIALKRLNIPMIVALNLNDIAQKHGLHIEINALNEALGLPVAATVAIRSDGVGDLIKLLSVLPTTRRQESNLILLSEHNLSADNAEALSLMRELGLSVGEVAPSNAKSSYADRFLLHPVWGSLTLLIALFLMFQAVFSLAETPMEYIEQLVAWLSHLVASGLPDGLLKGLLVDGVIAGIGGVLIFLPQIVILFFFILLFEESGYLARAALLMDRVMGKVGLTGRAFIPLLSSFACAIPGIMATRTIPDPKSRWLTVMLAPLMTCSARIPVYTLLIAAFIPATTFGCVITLQGLVMFGLYVAGVLAAVAVALVLNLSHLKRHEELLVMELPDYRLPYWRSIVLGLWQRVWIFLKRMGTTILVLSILLWAVCTFPAAPENSDRPAIEYSIAGQVGQAIAPVFAPAGFNWQIAVSLIPGMAAREVMVSSLSTIYAVDEPTTSDTLPEEHLAKTLNSQWSLATALALLAWFVFAPMCLPTLVTVQRELASRRSALFMLSYQFTLAYVAAVVVYQLTTFITAH